MAANLTPAPMYTFRADGDRGEDGVDGNHGYYGDMGCRGGDGGNATAPTRGNPGGSVQITLESAAGGGNVNLLPHVLKLFALCADYRGVTLKDYNDTEDLANVGNVVATSIGGDGGHGARGGDGGNGGPGKPGKDATMERNGTDGGNGGSGGDAGAGTSGADAGPGGYIKIMVFAGDEYLLMMVNGIDQHPHTPGPAGLVYGGVGGRAGAHGRPGAGGRGGRGGESFTWYEERTGTRVVYDGDGNSHTEGYTVTVPHTNRGGSNGWDGSDGRYCNTPLYNGNNGGFGTVELVVNGTRRGQGEATYNMRYIIVMDNFALDEEDGPNRDGVFEFGELCNAAGFVLRNVGGMPSPEQRSRVTLRQGVWVLPTEEDDTFLSGPPLQYNEFRVLPDRLRFHIAFPNTDFAEDFNPLFVHEAVQPMTVQLGIEPAGVPASRTPFQRLHDRAVCSRVVTAKFPTGNARGILGLRSLAPGEGTNLYFDLFNCSLLPLGAESGRRNVCIAIWLSPRSDVMPSALTLTGPDQREHSLNAMEESGLENRVTTVGDRLPGYVTLAPLINPNSTAFVTYQLKLADSVAAMSGVYVNTAMAIQDINRPAEWRVVQRRRIDIRAEPAFEARPDSRVVLVTTSNMEKSVYNAWEYLLGNRLGLVFEVYSTTRYAHLNPALPVLSDGKLLMDHLRGKIVVVPNLPFNIGPPTQPNMHVPSEFLPGMFVRSSVESDERPRFLFVGDMGSGAANPFACYSLRHLVEPVLPERNAALRNGGKDFKNKSTFWKAFSRKKSEVRQPDAEGVARDVAFPSFAAAVDSARDMMHARMSAISTSTDNNSLDENDVVVDTIPEEGGLEFAIPRAYSADVADELWASTHSVQANDLTTFYHKVDLHTWTMTSFFGLKKIKNGRKLKGRADKFTRRLSEESVGTAFTVVSTGGWQRDGSVWGIFPRWKLGTLELRGRRRATFDRSTAVHVFGPEAAGGTSSAVFSPSTLFGLALSFPFTEKLDRLTFLLTQHQSGGGAAQDESKIAFEEPAVRDLAQSAAFDTLLTEVFVKAIVADLCSELQEVTLMADSHKQVPERLTCLKAFREHEGLHKAWAVAPSSDMVPLMEALGLLTQLAAGVSSFFAPFGRKKTAAKQLHLAVKEFMDRMADGDKARAKVLAKALKAAVKAAKVLVKARRRMPVPLLPQGAKHPRRAALFDVCRRPVLSERFLTLAYRDVEVAAAESKACLSEPEWHQRVARETSRDSMAGAYYTISSKERAAMLVGPSADSFLKSLPTLPPPESIYQTAGAVAN